MNVLNQMSLDGDVPPTPLSPEETAKAIARYIPLRAVGSTLLPNKRLRVLATVEVDKSDIKLPNVLLNLLEEGEFEIPAVPRLAKQATEVKE